MSKQFEINITDLEEVMPIAEIDESDAPTSEMRERKSSYRKSEEKKKLEQAEQSEAMQSQAVVDTAGILLDFEQKTLALSKSIINQTLEHTAKTASDLLGGLKDDLAAIRQAKTQVMHYKINDKPIVKLDREPHSIMPVLIKLLSTRKDNGRYLNLYLHGPAGSGKTSIASDAAKILGLRFYAITATAGMSETWLLGRWTVKDFVEAGFMLALEHGGTFLFDEIAAADPNCLMIINSMIDQAPGSEIINPISGKTFKKHPDFRFIAADNTVGMGANGQFTGRNRMDAATRDRFWFQEIDYCPKIEERLCRDKALREKLQKARQVLRDKKSEYFIGTRKLEEVYCLKQQGFELETIFKGLTAGWPSELAKQAGLTA